MLVEQLEEHHLPGEAIFMEVVRVPPNTEAERHRTRRSPKARFALVATSVDDYRLSEMESASPYLCFCSYTKVMLPGEVVRSLEGKPFAGATVGRLLDLCRAHPRRRFNRPIAFIGSDGGYFLLRKRRDESYRLAPIYERDSLEIGWLAALQPTTPEMAKALEQIIQAEAVMQEMLVG